MAIGVKKIRISYRNRAHGATLSGGSWSATLPLTNLGNRNYSKLARSTDATLTSTVIRADLGSEYGLSVVALANHNFSLDTQIRITAFTDAYTTQKWQSEWFFVWPTAYTTDALEWEDDHFWTGTIPEEDRDGYTSVWAELLDTTQYARYWQIEIDDTGNADGYVEAGRLFMGFAWEPEINMVYGASFGWESETSVQRTLGGAEYADEYTPFRVLRFGLSHMTTTEAMQYAFELQRIADAYGEVYVHVDPGSLINQHRFQYIGRLRSSRPVTFEQYESNSIEYELKEVQ